MNALPGYGRHSLTRSIRLMIVDDSIVARSVFKTLLASRPEFRIVAMAAHAGQALAQLDETLVDIVLLDLALPGRDGLSVLPEIIRRGRGARVLIVSASASEGAEACVRAMTLGAADTLEKPSSGYGGAFEADLVDKLRRIGQNSRTPPDSAPEAVAAPPAEPPIALQPPVEGPVSCIAVGSSTGGLHALSAFFRALPADCRAPILLTQHLPHSFMRFFAAQITELAGRPAEVAEEGAIPLPGRVMIAPGDAHLTVDRGGGCVRIALDQAPAPSGCLPSVDPMLASVARVYGRQGFGVILSGMGRDGAIGARAMVDAGGEIAVQDKASSVIWGMPGATARAGLAATVASPERIARRIADRIAALEGARSWK